MGIHVIKLPDVGEGVAEAELVEWMVKEGAHVREDQVIGAVMTDKATVEIPSPVEGKVAWLGAKPGDIVSVGAPIIKLEVDGPGNESATAAAPPKPAEKKAAAEKAAKPAANGHAKSEPAAVKPVAAPVAAKPSPVAKPAPMRKEGEKPLASPAVRKRAADAGVDLRRVMGSGPAGRIGHDDLDAFMTSGGSAARPLGRSRAPDMTVTEVPVIGLRRKIAEKMQTAKQRIPHITYVDEVDMTALEDLRARLNAEKKEGRPKLTVLPFLMRAMARAIADQPQMNARFDDDAGVIHRSGGMHMGVATQTDSGLVVPVVRHVEALSIHDCARELARLAEAARDGKCTREELTGSTITITSLGAMGGIVTTPVINYPEVAIVGVNKMQVRPWWDGQQFVPRKIMNLSSSFDHRVIDGWDAAVFIQRIKGLLEAPATIFIED
jgi:2-oxoisovalerate dehydrogenase E2 component (dihydrolipoyl transacylase)